MKTIAIDRNTFRLWEAQGRDPYEWTESEISEAVTAVNKGASLLDQKKPGWVEKIIPPKLDMSSSTFCIIGQVYGEYDEYVGVPFGMGMFDDDGFNAEKAGQLATEHGFLTNDDDSYPFELLDRVWVYMLTVRSVEGVPVSLELP